MPSVPVMDVPGLGKPFESTDYEEDSDSDNIPTDIRRFLDPVHDYGEFGSELSGFRVSVR
jgi:hypothetical protein